MGSYVTRKDPRTGQDRQYYKADDGKLYQNYSAAVEAQKNFAQRFADNAVRSVQSGWQEADRRLGGWLPGGGTASPVTRAINPPQSYPSRTKELEKLTGIKSRIIDPEQNPTLVRRIAPFISPRWGSNDYANTILNEIGISGYDGGATPHHRSIEFHELGHLDPTNKGISGHLGVLGRSAQAISNVIGNPPPLDWAAGTAMQLLDANEEDRAERFAKRYEKVGNYTGPVITPQGTSEYGDGLRREGQGLVQQSIQRMTDPYGIVSGTTKVINQLRAGPVINELNQVESLLRKSLTAHDDASLTPEIIELSKKHSDLERQLKELGVNP